MTRQRERIEYGALAAEVAVVGWACKKCNKFWGAGEHGKHLASWCCCNVQACEDCGKDTQDKHWTKCNDCRRRADAERSAERLAKAELVEYDGGWVCTDDNDGPRDGGYFESMEELLDWYADEELDRPEEVFLCRENRARLDYDRIMEDVESNELEWDSEWGEPQWQGTEELQAAIDKFNMANEGVVTYSVDYRRKVKVTGE